MVDRVVEKLRSKIGRSGIEAGLAYFVRGLGAISLFLLYAVIAKRMPTADAGYMFLGLAAVTIFGPLSIFGLHLFSLRVIGARSFEEHADEIRYLGPMLRRRAMMISLVVSGSLFASAPWVAINVFQKPLLEGVLRWIAPSIFCTGLSVVIAHQLQGLRRFTASLFVLSIGTPLTCAIVLALLPSCSPVLGAKIYTIASVINLSIAIMCWYRTVGWGAVESHVEVPAMWTSCYSFWLVNAMILTVNWSGQLIAGRLVEDPAEVALLAVASRVANLVSFLLIGVNVIVTPKFARCWKEGKKDRLRDLALKSTAVMSLLALPVVVLIVVFAKPILVLFKPQYAAAAPLLVVLGMSQFFNVITGSVNQLLSMCGFEHDLRNIVILSGVTSLLLTIVLTLFYGVMGTAIAAAIALAIQNIAAVAMVRKRLGFSMLEAFRLSIWIAPKKSVNKVNS